MTTICFGANTINYPQGKGGGHFWVYLNWALGLRANGARVIWLESVSSKNVEKLAVNLAVLKDCLSHYGFDDVVALHYRSGEALPEAISNMCLDLSAAAESDALLTFCCDTRAEVVARFRRSALVDIDPGILQFWISQGKITPAAFDVFFSIGETVGRPETRFSDGGIAWNYVPPCVALDWWPVVAAPPGAAFTTVSHWNMDDSMLDGPEAYSNDKRTGFLPFLDLPKRARSPLELAICLSPEEGGECRMLQERGWRVADAWHVAGTPWDYQSYIGASLGEFSCAKPSYVRLQNAWISDRTLCYLASGKPAVIEHTGPSRFLPDAEGLLRFRTPDEAVAALDSALADYSRHCRAARQLAEAHFDATKVTKRVLERLVD